MNNRTFQSSGVKFGLILNPKKNNIVNGFENAFDKVRALPIKKKNILDLKHIEGLSIRELEDYDGIIEDNYLIFVMYDTIPANSTHKKQTFVRYTMGISINKRYDESPIEEIIGCELLVQLRSNNIKSENKIRAKAFLEKYKYGFFEKAKNYLSFI